VKPSHLRCGRIDPVLLAFVLAFDTNRVRTPPDGLASLPGLAFKGKVGLVDDQYDYIMLAGRGRHPSV